MPALKGLQIFELSSLKLASKFSYVNPAACLQMQFFQTFKFDDLADLQPLELQVVKILFNLMILC